MTPEENYIAINKACWNAKTKSHLNSKFYDVEGFLKGKSSLNDIELQLLESVMGKKILHLQCHFGQDSLSLQRMGAQVTGVDLSDEAIKSAKRLNETLQLNAQFVCCDIYELSNYLNDTFDIVFTSYGTIGWLPDLNRWAKLINRYLKPNGQFVFVEFHPVVWMFDNDFKTIAHRYFKSDAIIETESGTYADKTANISTKTITWNHALSEVITALLSQDLKLVTFQEYDYSPYDCFEETIEAMPGKFRIKHLSNTIPMVYALVAEKANY